jgi:NADH-ubiquinone oxidoreductase chain 5
MIQSLSQDSVLQYYKYTPTPVSALIHAATLVTAGVYLMLRTSPLLEYGPTALVVTAWLGAATATYAATCGLLVNDVKRVIAFSTCSQLGYMMMAIGLSQFSVGLFHLVTHAFLVRVLYFFMINCWHA